MTCAADKLSHLKKLQASVIERHLCMSQEVHDFNCTLATCSGGNTLEVKTLLGELKFSLCKLAIFVAEPGGSIILVN